MKKKKKDGRVLKYIFLKINNAFYNYNIIFKKCNPITKFTKLVAQKTNQIKTKIILFVILLLLLPDKGNLKIVYSKNIFQNCSGVKIYL